MWDLIWGRCDLDAGHKIYRFICMWLCHRTLINETWVFGWVQEFLCPSIGTCLCLCMWVFVCACDCMCLCVFCARFCVCGCVYCVMCHVSLSSRREFHGFNRRSQTCASPWQHSPLLCQLTPTQQTANIHTLSLKSSPCCQDTCCVFVLWVWPLCVCVCLFEH